MSSKPATDQECNTQACNTNTCPPASMSCPKLEYVQLSGGSLGGNYANGYCNLTLGMSGYTPPAECQTYAYIVKEFLDIDDLYTLLIMYEGQTIINKSGVSGLYWPMIVDGFRYSGSLPNATMDPTHVCSAERKTDYVTEFHYVICDITREAV